MKLTLNDEEKARVLPGIEAVLNGSAKAWEADEEHLPSEALIKAALTLKGLTKDKKADTNCSDGFDTNGWEWDWCQHFRHGGKSYVLTGSGALGGHSFHHADD